MATGKIMKLPEPETIPNAIALTSFQNNWQANGLSFYQVLGNVVHLHCSIRNGTYTDGTKVLQMGSAMYPSDTSLAPIFNLNDKAIDGYASISTTGEVKVNKLTKANAVFDLYWTTA